MGTANKPHTFVGDTKAKASEVNATFDALYNEFNGSVDENNINMTRTEFKTALLDAFKTVDGDGSGLDADLLDGKHYTDIQNWVNTSADVPNADNADTLNGEKWVLLKEGSLTINTLNDVLLKSGGQHNHYMWSAYGSQDILNHRDTNGTSLVGYIIQKPSTSEYDKLKFVNETGNPQTIYYSVYSWE